MIREAREEDMSALMALAGAFHKAAHYKRLATFEESVLSWERWLLTCVQSKTAICVVAEKEGALIGFCTALIFPAYWNDRVFAAQETALWVTPEKRGSGAGGKLLNFVVEWAKQNGAHVMAAGSTVYMNPKQMGAFLRKHGFKLEERNYSRKL